MEWPRSSPAGRPAANLGVALLCLLTAGVTTVVSRPAAAASDEGKAFARLSGLLAFHRAETAIDLFRLARALDRFGLHSGRTPVRLLLAARRIDPDWNLPLAEALRLCAREGGRGEGCLDQDLVEAAARTSPSLALLAAGYCLDTGRYEEAVRHYERSAGAGKPGQEMARGLGAALFRLGRFREAAGMLERQPDDIGSLSLLAEAYERDGRIPEAAASWRRLALLLPDQPFLHEKIASFFERNGMAAEARAYRSKAERLEPARGRRQLRPLR